MKSYSGFAPIFSQNNLDRRVTDNFLGVPILNIPAVYPTLLLQPEFSDFEKRIYDTLCTQLQRASRQEFMRIFGQLRLVTSHWAMVDNSYLDDASALTKPTDNSRRLLQRYCGLCKLGVTDPQLSNVSLFFELPTACEESPNRFNSVITYSAKNA
jgi:hypothetical protein